MSYIAFNVPGHARPKGAGMSRKIKGGRTIRPKQGDACRTWEAIVKFHSTKAAFDAGVKLPTREPVRVRLEFNFEKPNSHDGKKPAKFKGPHWPPRSPTRAIGDIDKLTRAVLDGITGSIIEDDYQVHRLIANKQYGHSSHVVVVVEWDGE